MARGGALEPGLLVEERALLGRAVENLLSNAPPSTSPEGAEIRVTAAGPLSGADGGKHPPAARPRPCPTCSRPFTGPSPPAARASGGSGLGLYLVRMIAERHGGTCRIENSADGVRFTALLPRLSTENT